MSAPASPRLDTKQPLPEELVERAAGLRAQLAEDADEVDKARRLTDRGIAAITDAGLLRLMVPRRLGGYETDLRTLVDVTAALARGCGSSGWVAGILNAGAWLTAVLPDQAQREVWGDNPAARVAGVLAPSAEVEYVDGGIVVNGKWGYASGCLHSEWIIAGARVSHDGGEPEHSLFLVPMSDLEIEDTWYVAGMRGTGSNTIVAHDVFVPHHRIMSLPRALQGEYPTEHKDEVLYRASLPGVLMIAVMGTHLGLAEAALEIVLEKAPRRAIASTTYATQTESTAFQVAVAQAAIKIDTARMHIYRAADDIYQAAVDGGLAEPLARARSRMDCGWASQQVQEAIDLLMTAHGTSAFAEASPLQRIWRDQGTASRHAITATNVCNEIYGRALLGVEPQISMLV